VRRERRRATVRASNQAKRSARAPQHRSSRTRGGARRFGTRAGCFPLSSRAPTVRPFSSGREAARRRSLSAVSTDGQHPLERDVEAFRLRDDNRQELDERGELRKRELPERLERSADLLRGLEIRSHPAGIEECARRRNEGRTE